MSREQIWAPWRLSYVQGDAAADQAKTLDLPFRPGADRDCFLCQAVADRQDRMRGVVFRGQRVAVLLNRYPYNNGHLLVCPLDHLARLDELDSACQTELMATIVRMVQALEGAIAPHGFNVGLNLGRVAGAGLPGHLHWHIVPRWNGDTNFMPVLNNTNVIPQSLDALWEALDKALRLQG